MTTTDDFKKTFEQFLHEINKVIPYEYKSDIFKINCVIQLKNIEETVITFFQYTQPYQKQILLQDDTFINEIKSQFPMLKSYQYLDTNSQKVCLEYLKLLYLQSYKVLENKIK